MRSTFLAGLVIALLSASQVGLPAAEQTGPSTKLRTFDGRPVIDFRGEPSRLDLSKYWRTPREAALFLGTYDCRYRFLRLTLAPVSGTGKRL